MLVLSRTLLLSIALIIVSIVLWIATNDITEPASWQSYGSADFPRVLIATLGGLSLLLLIREILFSDKASVFPEILRWFTVEYRIFLGIVLFGVYILVMAELGFILATISYLAGSLVLFWQPFSLKRILISAVLCITVTLAVYFVFETVLAIRLP